MDPELQAWITRNGIDPSEAERLRSLVDGGTAARTFDPMDPDAPMDAAPLGTTEVWERYEDLGPIGAGGMGEVRRVRDGCWTVSWR